MVKAKKRLKISTIKNNSTVRHTGIFLPILQSIFFWIKKDYYRFLLILLCITFFISHFLYVSVSHAYPEWDEHKYLGAAVHFLPVLQHPEKDFFQKMLQVQKQYLPSAPPFYPLSIDVMLLLFGTANTYKLSLWLNGIFYILTIVGVYKTSKEFLSEKASLLAAFIFTCYGFPLFYVHFAYTETTATAFVIWALYFLARTKNFTDRRNVIYFSLCFAISLFTRWTSPFFIVGSLIVVFVSGLWNKQRKHLFIPVFKNIGVYLFVSLVPVVLYYVPNFSDFLNYLKVNKLQGPSWVAPYLQNPFSPHSLIWYASVIAQQTIFFYLLFIGGILICLWKIKKYIFLLIAVFLPYMVLTLSSSFKDDRFIVLMYPSIAIISATVFDFFQKKTVAIRMLIVLTLCIGFLNFISASWGIGPLQPGGYSILLPMPIGHPRRVWIAPISWPPRSDEAHGQEIVNAIKSDWNRNTAPRVLSTFEMSQVNGQLYKIIAYENIDVVKLYSLKGIKPGDYRMFFNTLINSNYLLVKNGIIDLTYKEGTDKTWDNIIFFARKFNKAYSSSKSKILPGWVPVKTINIPFDKSELTVYRKIREITKEEWELLGIAYKNIDPGHEKNIQDAVQYESKQ
jgi:hypothetical protein